MRVEVVTTRHLLFDDGSAVRAASGIAALGDGWLVAQDDTTHGCWLRGGAGAAGTRLRLLPPVEGHDAFDEESGTKHLKPDLEAACPVDGGVLLLGSGSTPARMRSVLVPAPGEEPVVAHLGPLYARVAAAADVPADELNLEGACLVGGSLRWFHRGRPAAGLPSVAVDLPLDTLLVAARGGSAEAVEVQRVHLLELGEDLAVTDAVALGDGTVLVSGALEDSPNAYDDGPVLASGIARLRDDALVDQALLPEVAGAVAKVEGLALVSRDPEGLDLLATVDADDPSRPSSVLELRVTW